MRKFNQKNTVNELILKNFSRIVTVVFKINLVINNANNATSFELLS